MHAYRTHTCGALRASDAGQEARLVLLEREADQVRRMRRFAEVGEVGEVDHRELDVGVRLGSFDRGVTKLVPDGHDHVVAGVEEGLDVLRVVGFDAGLDCLARNA